jgi:hypothetical protein
MMIDPEAEGQTRTLIGHAIRGETDDLGSLLAGLSADRLTECLVLCLRVSGYVAIDICGHSWPSDADLRDIARRIAAVDLDFKLEEPDAYAYLSRSALGFQRLSDIFTDKGKVIVVPVLATAALLASYRAEGRHWWEYLDIIEHALEQAAPLPKETVPAVLLLSRLNHANESGSNDQPTAEAQA